MWSLIQAVHVAGGCRIKCSNSEWPGVWWAAIVLKVVRLKSESPKFVVPLVHISSPIQSTTHIKQIAACSTLHLTEGKSDLEELWVSDILGKSVACAPIIFWPCYSILQKLTVDGSDLYESVSNGNASQWFTYWLHHWSIISSIFLSACTP